MDVVERRACRGRRAKPAFLNTQLLVLKPLGDVEDQDKVSYRGSS